MALTATIHRFDIDLADADRQVYETLGLQAARHPSESAPHLIARVLAYALELTEGIAFSRGVSDAEEPAIVVRDLTGACRAWIEVGTPEAARLHRAGKVSPRVAVYAHKDPARFLSRLAGERIHRVHALELYALDRDLIAGLVARLDRRMAFALAVVERELFVSIGDDTLSGRIDRLPVPDR
ncbi:MAG: YaeQ family protein [Acidobacteria bacterium]|nr:YaeQ family protein [Acidobacteriota bacterium]